MTIDMAISLAIMFGLFGVVFGVLSIHEYKLNNISRDENKGEN
jgi:hypothetical protein